MIENFLYLLYNDSMSKYVKTMEYSYETFVADLNKNIIIENDILSSGFKEENGVFKYVKNPLKTQSYIVLESKNAIENLFSIALAIKNILQFYHITNIGVLFGNDKMVEEYLNKRSSIDVLFLHFLFDNQPNFMPCDNALLGKCNYEILPYPKLLQGKEELILLANKVGLTPTINNGKIVGEQYFSDLTELENIFLDFSRCTSDFDKVNSVLTRIFVNDITLPVKNNEYYADIFSFLPKMACNIEYDGRAGNVLDKNSGVMLCINVNNDENIESFYKCVKTYLEDING